MNSEPARAATRAETGLRYRLPAPAGTLWLGLGWPALSGLAASVSLSVLLAVAGSLGIAVLIGLVGASVSLAQASGRPLLGWIGPAAGHLVRRAHGTHRSTQRPQSAPDSEPVRLALGISPRPVTLLPLQGDGCEAVGLLKHGRGSDRTVVLEVISTGRFGLLDATSQDSEIGRWSRALTALLTDPAVRTVQWLTHTRPDTRAVTGQTGATLEPGHGTALSIPELNADYADLVQQVHRQAVQHRHLLALTLRVPSRDSEDVRAVLDATRAVATALLSADLLSRPLNPAQLGTALRQLLDPALEDHGQRQDPASWSHLSTREQWTHCRTDGTLHRAFAVTGWPRLELPADWLAPLLHDSLVPGTARTLSLHVRPVAAAVAARRARALAAKAHLDETDRSRLGFAPAATDHLTAQDAAATEDELLAGYRMTDLSAVLVVTAPDLPVLDDACRQLLATAASQHLDMRVLHGQHRQALASALPLALHPGGLS
jgi:hypothetical protein